MTGRRRKIPKSFRGVENLDFYLGANVSPANTGLPFVVWIWERSYGQASGGATHDVVVRATKKTKAYHPRDFVAVSLRPSIRVVGRYGRKILTAPEMSMLRRWIKLNRRVIIGCWDGKIGDTMKVLQALRPVPQNGPAARSAVLQ